MIFSIWCPLAFQRLLVLFYMLVFFNLLSSSHATTSDTLAPGQTISDVDGQTLVSANGVFELGFFSPASSTYRYLGVWYRNITPQTVVWVANREAPIADSSGALSISSSTGDLVLLNGRGNVKWSTNSSAGPINTTAYLANKGNLILRSVTNTNGQEFSLWESFDHPGDTFLPGMKISLNRTSGKGLLYTSWKSHDDPSSGNYSLGLDPSGSGQLFMWDGTAIRWRSGQWNRSTFIGTAMRALSLYGFQLITDDNGLMYYTYDPQNNTLLRFVLEWNGVENTTLLSEENQDWITVWVQPTSECEIYGKCGIYGVCSNETTATTCSCLQGFEPKSSEEWKQGKWTEGCVRKTSLSCPQNKSGDGFFTLPGVKVPDLADWDSTFDVQDVKGCQNACLNNCSCKAYALVNGIGCLVWGRDLIDIYQFPQGKNDGYDLYVKISRSDLVTSSPADNRNKSWKTIVIASILAGASLLVISFIFWWKCKGKLQGYRKEKHQEQIVSSSMYSIKVPKSDASKTSDNGGGREKELTELPLFTLSSISAATDNFSDANKLGEGGFGHVYKGELPGGEMVAVKRLSKTSGQGSEEFKNEVLLIAKLQHRNLVRLLGCCIHEEEKILVYEYMPNKSLDAILFDDEKKATLDWNRRFNIIEGIARGLLYLHRDSRLRVVHRDLKASNILLDSDMNPKISDFGMAKIFGGDKNQDNTGRVVGTLGYMSPEYAMEGIFSDKSDVYSYGILLLEIVTGLKNSSFHQTNSLNIVGHVWQMWNEDRTQELIDPSIRTSCLTMQAMRCIHVGLLCVQDRAGDRPDMQSVILMMGKQAGLLPMPRQPVFVSEESCVPNGFSVNDLTVTSFQGR